ncbi:unnamed protein product [Didymodactylos carnosus]|uniref:Uncharacterized protein n=1 Tax=Didymodactylos carnosus TaxID=1234261 RepID=A0A814R5R7_9BILA|nr:unnamed protein product [Didymodactylos carnosus]CAF1127482.1 unnamed protein product [Didymodactylos carnosus]CAF3701064.1 unnamed protein product [Didymodactylos carnosus]CAF3890993.1 unnamed protein product [Didymodactylos carnosus]
MDSSTVANTTNNLHRSLSLLEDDAFYTIFRQQYNASWGTLIFENSPNDYTTESTYFLLVDDLVDLSSLLRFMITKWNLDFPNIVISVLSSSVSNNKSWRNQKQTESLKQGIKNAANASEVWFITNGLDVGAPQLIGTAFREEKSLRRADDAWAVQMGRTPKARKFLMLIGIVCANDIKDLIDLKIKNQPDIELKVPVKKRDQLSLNNDHTHFIIIRNKSKNIDEKRLEKFDDSVESSTNKFRDRFENYLRKSSTTDNQSRKSVRPEGDKNDTDYENFYLKVEIARRLIEEYPALKDNNMKRNDVRDYIIEIVRKADQGRRKFLTFIDINKSTSLNDFDKYVLSSFIQSQKSVTGHRLITQLKHNLQLTLDWNLYDLALSEIFQGEDNSKYNISYELFDKALLGKNLEQFIDLFLNRGFSLHTYLKSDKLVDLFQQSNNREFLTTTSLEGILGLTGDEEDMPENFVECGLNTIVKSLTGISYFFNKYEMNCNAMGIYFGNTSDSSVFKQRIRAEKKALRHLIIFAVLMNRHQLAKVLWKRSSEPIPLALMCNMMFRKLATYCHESYQRLLIEKQAKEFSDYAVGVLDKSFNEDGRRTFDMLDEKHAEFMAHAACQKWLTRQFYGEITPREMPWGLFKTPIYFKIITSACLIFPMWFWINFSPIGQAEPAPEKESDLQDKLQKRTLIIDEQIEVFNSLIQLIMCSKHNNAFKRLGNILRGFRQVKSANPKDSSEKSVTITEKIVKLWSAPITKFYTNFISYLTFLSLFTVAVLWPSCGNLLLDCFVWFWAASLAFENGRVAYEKYCSQSSLPLQQTVLEVIVQTTFLALYLGLRIIGLWTVGTCQILTAKAVLGIGLIYYYYRILFIFLPISPKLGPMMIRLRSMIMDDFVTFLQLFLIFMVSSGAAITAVLYPHFPMSLELFVKAFVFRGLMALFTSDMDDLKNSRQHCSINATSDSESEYACLRLSNGFSSKYDNLNSYQRYGISSPKCNQTSWIAWVLLIQYLFMATQFLTSLLTAMFGLTGARVQSQSEQIWMYNRYEIVMEYEKRPRLPPPFIVLSYVFMIISAFKKKCVQKLKEYAARSMTNQMRTQSSNNNSKMKYVRNKKNRLTQPLTEEDNLNLEQPNNSCLGRLLTCKLFKQLTESAEAGTQLPKTSSEDSEANLYWKHRAEEFYAKAQVKDEMSEKLINLSNTLTSAQNDIVDQQKSLRQINDHIISLETLMINHHILIEKIYTKLQQGGILDKRSIN